jgi:hypothetical protein
MQRSVLAALAATLLLSTAAPAFAQPYPPPRGEYRHEAYRDPAPRYAERHQGGYGYAREERDDGADVGAIIFGAIAGGLLAAVLSQAN